jgi:hypothetical protein
MSEAKERQADDVDLKKEWLEASKHWPDWERGQYQRRPEVEPQVERGAGRYLSRAESQIEDWAQRRQELLEQRQQHMQRTTRDLSAAVERVRQERQPREERSAHDER